MYVKGAHVDTVIYPSLLTDSLLSRIAQNQQNLLKASRSNVIFFLSILTPTYLIVSQI